MSQKGLAPIVIILLIAIGIGGYLVYSGKINFPQKQTNQQVIETSDVDETDNWKTYRDAELGYSLKYPQDWVYKEIEYKSNGTGDTAPSFTGIGLRPKLSSESYNPVSIQIFDNPNNLYLEDFIKDWYSFSTRPDALLKAFEVGKDIRVDELYSKKIINPPVDTVGLPVTWVLSRHNNKVFLLSVTLDKSYPEVDKEQVFDKIISTFKFLDEANIDTNKWRTYTHPKLKFSVKLPENIVPVREQDDTVTFVKKEESNSKQFFSTSIFVATRTGPDPEAAVKSETCGGCTVTSEKANINNAIGLKTILGYGKYNYYLTDEKKIGPVVRVSLSSDNGYPDVTIFKKVLDSFRFER